MNEPERGAGAPRKTLSFGPYRLIPATRSLMREDALVPMGARALDILIALAEYSGSILSKDQLLAAAWPNASVHEANLRVHIAGLRKLLGEGRPGERYIVNEAGRGYRFVAPVSVTEEAPAIPAAAPVRHETPEPLRAGVSAAIGRSEIVKALVEDLPRRRLVTLVGPGGVGKTTVALAVAERVARELPTVFVDLGPLADPSLVGSKICAALGLATRSDEPISELVAFLREKRMLIALDTCEHVIEAVAPLIERAMAGAPGLQILATSREPLRAKGEWIHRLAPLAAPGPEPDLRAEEALAFPAVRLFVERAGASLDGFELTDADAPLVARICRKLDGLPLAIELAASRIDAFGLRGLSDLLDRRLHLPGVGRRAVAARHRTLAAMLDWSYETLPETERMTLRRLAVFAGPFTLEAATRTAADLDLSRADALESLANLVERSLVAADLSNLETRYRLLDTTRAYALGKLEELNEQNRFARRHADYYKDLFERNPLGRERRPAAWIAENRSEIDNVRAALDWAFSPLGDSALGVALTLAVIPLWIHLSMNEECRARVEAALAALDREGVVEDRVRMQLFAALAGALFMTKGYVPKMSVAWSSALAIAEKLGDSDFQLRALWGLWLERLQGGEFRAALATGQKFKSVAIASGDESDILISDRIVGVSLFLLGEQEEARRLIERMANRYTPHPADIPRFQAAPRVIARTYLSMVLWLLGFPDQAMRMSEKSVEYAKELGHAISLTHALGLSACPIALYVGDPAAAAFVTMLRGQAVDPGSTQWDIWARCYGAVLRIKSGDPAGGAAELAEAIDALPANSYHMRYIAFLCELAGGLCADGQLGRAEATIEKAIELAQRSQELWLFPDLLRLRGEIAWRNGALGEAEASFADSLDWAQRQKALSWELRAATSLARLWREQGRAAEARHLLAPVYGRFTEGFATHDLMVAKTLLDQLV